MYTSVAERGKRNASKVGSVVPVYTRPGLVQVRTWTFPQVDPHRTGVSGPHRTGVSGPHRTGSRRSRVNAKPIWTQSGIGPRFIQSRVNEALISVCTKRNNTYKKSAKSSV